VGNLQPDHNRTKWKSFMKGLCSTEEQKDRMMMTCGNDTSCFHRKQIYLFLAFTIAHMGG